MIKPKVCVRLVGGWSVYKTKKTRVAAKLLAQFLQ